MRIVTSAGEMVNMAVITIIALMYVAGVVIMVTADPGKQGEEYDCHIDLEGHAYRGNLSKTWGNHTCRSWTDGLAIAHNVTAETYPDAGLGDHNYCRNPQKEGAAPGCLTEDIDVLWEYCEVGMFHPDCRHDYNDPQECYVQNRAADYRGRVNVTWTGIPCQKWSVQEPQPHPYTQEAYPTAGLGDHNYCRNPSPFRFYAWCYTTLNQVEWDFCNIGLPKPTCSGICEDDE